MFVRKKYRTNTPAVHPSLRLNGTWPSGRLTEGIRVSTGSAASFQLMYLDTPDGGLYVLRFELRFGWHEISRFGDDHGETVSEPMRVLFPASIPRRSHERRHLARGRPVRRRRSDGDRGGREHRFDA